MPRLKDAALACLCALWSSQVAVLFAAEAQTLPTPEELRVHSGEFREQVIEVTQDVHVAVGYAASNVILVQAPDGLIVIDTSPNPTEAEIIRRAFGSLWRGPVRAIIYTHSHPDHTGGASVFAGTDAPQIIAAFAEPDAAPGRANRDGGDQFGMTLPEPPFINAGVQKEFGREVRPTREGYLAPTHVVTAPGEVFEIAGLHLELISTPGETADTITVWLPDQRVLATGDNVLRAFPNLAPIRGTRSRSPEAWIASLDRILKLDAEYLIPGHMGPIIGAAEIQEVVSTYRDGIQSINDQTLAGIRRGERPDELVAHVRLPEDLAASDYLREYYGSVEWMVRGVYAAQLGWFDGNATNLFPLKLSERADRLLALIGGADHALSAGCSALQTGDYVWAAELADLILAKEPANLKAKQLKIQALRGLGEQQGNAIARNYYFSVAQHLSEEAAPAN